MRVDRHAAAVVDDCQAVADVERHLDPVRMARDGLVHAVVDHLGGEVVQRAFVGAADIHAGAAANGLKPFEYFDLRGIVAVGRGGGAVEQIVTHMLAIGGRKGRWQARFSGPRAYLAPGSVHRISRFAGNFGLEGGFGSRLQSHQKVE